MRTHHVTITATHHGCYNCYLNGTLLAEGTRTPFKDAARALVTGGYAKDADDLVVFKMSGATGNAHDALVNPIATLAGRDWLKTALAASPMRPPAWPPPGRPSSLLTRVRRFLPIALAALSAARTLIGVGNLPNPFCRAPCFPLPLLRRLGLKRPDGGTKKQKTGASTEDA
jgi:hypothetical protein